MYDDSIYSAVALSLAIILALIGAVQLAGPRFVRETYRRWGYGQHVRSLTGVLDIIAAIMLATPDFRGWGIALAAILTFGSVIVFLNHGQYRYALPTIGLMIALVPATIAVPRPAQVQFVSQAPFERSRAILAADQVNFSNESVTPAVPGGAERDTF